MDAHKIYHCTITSIIIFIFIFCVSGEYKNTCIGEVFEKITN